MGKVDFDTALLEIGEFGRYQRLVLWLLCIPGCFMNAFNGYCLVFLMYTPDHLCKLNASAPNGSQIAEECHIVDLEGNRSKCSEWDYDTYYFSETLITKFNLVCDSAIDAKIVLSLISTITVLGCLGYSYILDRWGRKIAFEINLVTYIVGGTLSLFMPTLASFTAVRVVASINGISTFNICYVWALEYTGPSHRTYVTMVFAY